MEPTGIMSLKNDILFELFALIAASDPPQALPWKDPGPLPYHLGWIRLTHVCRLWRNFLIDEMPSLWARSVSLLPTAHDTMLARAQDVPLDLTTNNSHGTYLALPSGHSLHDRLRDFAFAHIARARSLIADNMGIDWVPHLESKHLPLLKSIDIHQAQPYGDATPVAALLPLDAPNLSFVRAHDMAMTFTSQSIRHLTLHGKQMFNYDKWVLLDVIRSLSSSLEYFELEMRPPSRVDWQLQTTSPISLERLKHYHLYGSANSNIVQLVGLLDVPMPLEEHTYYVHIEPEGWERFVHALGRTLRQPLFNALFYTDDSNQIVASTFAVVDKPEDYPGSAVQEVTLEVEYGSDYERAKAVTTALLHPLDRSRIEQIIFGYDIADEKIDDARNTFRPFEAVTSFAAMSHDALKILCVTEENPLPIFPRLSFLVAAMEGKYGDKKWDIDSLRAWWDTLCGALEGRARAGVPIPRIRLACNASPFPATDELREVDAQGLARVKELVPELEDTRKILEDA